MIRKYKNHTPQIDSTCFIADGSAVIGKVKIGKNSSIWYNAVLRGDIAAIVIGENTNIQDASVLHCINDVDVKVGSGVTVGHNAILHSCTIGDNTLIGMGSIILDRVVIGKNCIIGAGSVVTPYTEIPDRSLVLGSPGKIKRQLSDEDIEHIKLNAEVYINLANDYKSNI